MRYASVKSMWQTMWSRTETIRNSFELPIVQNCECLLLYSPGVSLIPMSDFIPILSNRFLGIEKVDSLQKIVCLIANWSINENRKIGDRLVFGICDRIIEDFLTYVTKSEELTKHGFKTLTNGRHKVLYREIDVDHRKWELSEVSNIRDPFGIPSNIPQCKRYCVVEYAQIIYSYF